MKSIATCLLLFALLVPAAGAAEKPYIDRGDGTIADLSSQVLWQKNAPPYKMTWNEARSYCTRLKVGEIKIWSLPTLGQLKKLQADLHQPDSGAKPLFADSTPLPYWSLTEDARFNNNAWTVDFASGNAKLQDKKTRQLVRCER